MTKTNLSFFMLVGLSLMLSLPAWADFQAAVMDAYDRGDYDTALKEFRPLAEQGDSKAQFKLGIMYDNGFGVPQDYKEATRWCRLAAEQGDSLAQPSLGYRYYKGLGVRQDYAEAGHTYVVRETVTFFPGKEWVWIQNLATWQVVGGERPE